jgi:hypothetical protein
MRGIIGVCVSDLAPGEIIRNVGDPTMTMKIIRTATKAEANEVAMKLTGKPVDGIVPGEKFYEVEIIVAPINN